MKIASLFATCCAVWFAVLPSAAEARSRVSLLGDDEALQGGAPSATVGTRVASLESGRLALPPVLGVQPAEEAQGEDMSLAARRAEAQSRASTAFNISALVGGGVGLIAGVAFGLSYPGGLLASTLGLLGGAVGLGLGLLLGLAISQSILADAGVASGGEPRVPVTKDRATAPQLSVSVAPVLVVLPKADGLLGGVAVRF